MTKTNIAWATDVWNPFTGCSPVSAGCLHCYAELFAETRLRGRFGYDKDVPFKPTFHPDRLEEPLKVKKPCRVFVCSMGDIFHEKNNWADIEDVFEIMGVAHWHQFILCTKRIYRPKYWAMCNMNIPWHSNITLLVSVEDQATADERIPQLLQIPAHTRGVSVEPLLEPVDLRQYLPKLDWVIVGGETGKNARHSDPEWILSLEDQCREAGVPFFFKQWGTDGNGHKLQLAKCGLGLPRQYPKSLELK